MKLFPESLLDCRCPGRGISYLDGSVCRYAIKRIKLTSQGHPVRANDGTKVTRAHTNTSGTVIVADGRITG